MSISQFYKDNYLRTRFLKYLSKSKEGKRYYDVHQKIIEKASNERYKGCKYITNGLQFNKSYFQLIEVKLYNIIKECRAKHRKVSKSVIKIQS